MVDLTQTLPQRLTGAGFTLHEKGRCLYLYRNQDHQGYTLIAKLPVKATVLNVAEMAERYLKLKIGEIRRAGEIGKRGKKPSEKYILHACVICGKIRWVQLANGKPTHLKCQSCAHWKGGKYRDCRGYMFIHLSPDSPFFPMTNSKGFVPVHRLVMAQYLGRCLYKGERVQTRNRIKTDVRIENLRLISKPKYRKAKLYGGLCQGKQGFLERDFPPVQSLTGNQRGRHLALLSQTLLSQTSSPVPYCAEIGILVAR